MGGDAKKGETYLNYVVPREYGDSNGFQAGSTFKAFVLSAAISQGIPLSTRINAPQTVSLPVSSFRDCQGPIRSSDVWNPQNSTGAGTFDLYTGTQLSVNTFFAQLEQRTGLCKPVSLARQMGVDVPEPGLPAVHARRLRHQPADDGRAPTRPSPPAACTARPDRSPRS